MFIGIDIGGSKTKGILTDRTGKELSFKEIETKKTAKEIDDDLYQIIETLATSASISKMDIKAVGIGTPGPIDKEKGVILKAPNIPAFSNHPIVKNLEARTGIRVFLENDATVAILGAWWKENVSKYRNWLMITLGTGIGGGLIIDNKIYTGQSGNAMEVGHMTIDLNGKECPCGNRGCWERYASGPALVELALAHLKKQKGSSIAARMKTEELTPLMVYEEAVKKDETALAIFEEYSTYVGIGIVNLVNIFNPEAIFLGGGLSQSYRIMLPTVKRIIKKSACPGFKDNVTLYAISDPLKIPAYGAAKIAINATGA